MKIHGNTRKKDRKMENYIKKNSIGLAWRNAIEKVFEKGKTVHDGEVRIRRAEEIYNKRKNKNVRVSSATVNSGQRTTWPLLKKMILQLLICTVIYFIFYLIKNNNYIFSEEVMNKTSEILKYDINFSNLYNKALVYIDNKKPLSEEIENNVENVDAENTDGNDMQDENVEQSEINGVGGRRKCGDSGSGNRTICRKNTDGIRCGVHKRKL